MLIFPASLVQTLAHLAQILQWPRFHVIRDTHDVLLAQSEETYQFIEKVQSAFAPPNGLLSAHHLSHLDA